MVDYPLLSIKKHIHTWHFFSENTFRGGDLPVGSVATREKKT